MKDWLQADEDGSGGRAHLDVLRDRFDLARALDARLGMLIRSGG